MYCVGTQSGHSSGYAGFQTEHRPTGFGHADTYIYRYSYGNANAYANEHGDQYSNLHTNAHGDTITDSYIYADTVSNIHLHTITDSYPIGHADYYSS